MSAVRVLLSSLPCSYTAALRWHKQVMKMELVRFIFTFHRVIQGLRARIFVSGSSHLIGAGFARKIIGAPHQ
jgi:hypothetical protein